MTKKEMTFNQWVVGSIPTGRTNFSKGLCGFQEVARKPEFGKNKLGHQLNKFFRLPAEYLRHYLKASTVGNMDRCASANVYSPHV